jgi:hypothetical protein
VIAGHCGNQDDIDTSRKNTTVQYNSLALKTFARIDLFSREVNSLHVELLSVFFKTLKVSFSNKKADSI